METPASARTMTNQPPTDATRSATPQAGGRPLWAGVAQRLDASLVPAIKGVSISPHEASATLVNISSSGTLVECERRYNPGSPVTVRFSGTFRPTTVPGRVARATVSGVGQNGSLKYRMGIAFNAPIALPEAATAGLELSHAVGPASPPAPTAPTAPAARPHGILRNSW